MQSIYPTSQPQSLPLNNDEWPSISSISQPAEIRPRLEDISFDSVLDKSLNSTQSVSLEQPKTYYTPSYEWDIVKPIVTLDFLNLHRQQGKASKIPDCFNSYTHYQKSWTWHLKNEVWAKMLHQKQQGVHYFKAKLRMNIEHEEQTKDLKRVHLFFGKKTQYI